MNAPAPQQDILSVTTACLELLRELPGGHRRRVLSALTAVVDLTDEPRAIIGVDPRPIAGCPQRPPRGGLMETVFFRGDSRYGTAWGARGTKLTAGEWSTLKRSIRKWRGGGETCFEVLFICSDGGIYDVRGPWWRRGVSGPTRGRGACGGRCGLHVSSAIIRVTARWSGSGRSATSVNIYFASVGSTQTPGTRHPCPPSSITRRTVGSASSSRTKAW